MASVYRQEKFPIRRNRLGHVTRLTLIQIPDKIIIKINSKPLRDWTVFIFYNELNQDRQILCTVQLLPTKFRQRDCIEAPVTNELAVAANNAVKYIHTMYLRANDINGQHLKSDLVIMNGRLHLFITSQVTTRLGSNLRLHKLIIINVT